MRHVHNFNIYVADVCFIWSYNEEKNMQKKCARMVENLTRNGCEQSLNGPREVVIR